MLETLQRSQASEKTKTILKLYSEGESVINLANWFNVTRSRVYYLAKKYGVVRPKKQSQPV